MKKDDLKKLLKPLVKQCIKEVLFEEGVLSSIVSEVVTGLSSDTLLESKTNSRKRTEQAAQKLHEQQDFAQRQKMKETREQMLEAIGQSSYNGVNLFEDTKPLASAGTPTPTSPNTSPLSGLDPADPGIDISGLMNKTVVWKNLVGGDK